MKLVISAAILLAICGTAFAEAGIRSKMRVADATADTCFSNCASENASCKRACPTTFNTPCLSSCDSQMQTCRGGCQRK
jgi:hypothetical protein